MSSSFFPSFLHSLQYAFHQSLQYASRPIPPTGNTKNNNTLELVHHHVGHSHIRNELLFSQRRTIANFPLAVVSGIRPATITNSTTAVPNYPFYSLCWPDKTCLQSHHRHHQPDMLSCTWRQHVMSTAFTLPEIAPRLLKSAGSWWTPKISKRYVDTRSQVPQALQLKLTAALATSCTTTAYSLSR